MNIIDFDTKGNAIRFYLGENGKQWGDDWNDAPYEHNAGRVYEEFNKGHFDLLVPYKFTVWQPSDGHANSEYSKEDMIKRKVPCIVICEDMGDIWSFEKALAVDGAFKIYFGDTEEQVRKML